ncbi:MAG TPA: hypothetical protein DDW76_22715 [Cyanobacteria bacterium UBA11369]|nr:hypothetical protein [Cyanobacteria bacterium UBA11371]HBE34141.1 hypothetical protein [Cyanobacteria bacterium UBA11368]HBE51511.1 hypothetical protein [Cyanobacteria bacterium UBA11369]
MARLYADEQFPKRVVELLRKLGHDVLTVQQAGKANRKIPDQEVLAFAVSEQRAVLTLNRQDFFRLHRLQPEHFGIIACKDNRDRETMAARINEAISAVDTLSGKLIRVKRPQG